MITATRFASVFCTDPEKASDFWSEKIGLDVRMLDVPYGAGSSYRRVEDPNDHLPAAVRLVQRELGGIVVR